MGCNTQNFRGTPQTRPGGHQEPKDPYIGLYGNVSIPKVYCEKCHGYYLVIGGKLSCCDSEVIFEANRFKRESPPDQKRKIPSKSIQIKILKAQNHCCIYCGSQFGFIRYRGTKRIKLRIEWDHRVPYSYTQNNYHENFVAACHVCNGIKSDMCFKSIDEAAIYIAGRREEKGYNF